MTCLRLNIADLIHRRQWSGRARSLGFISAFASGQVPSKMPKGAGRLREPNQFDRYASPNFISRQL